MVSLLWYHCPRRQVVWVLSWVLLSCGTYGNVLRVLVPLTAEDELLDRGLAIIAECFDELA